MVTKSSHPCMHIPCHVTLPLLSLRRRVYTSLLLDSWPWVGHVTTSANGILTNVTESRGLHFGFCLPLLIWEPCHHHHVIKSGLACWGITDHVASVNWHSSGPTRPVSPPVTRYVRHHPRPSCPSCAGRGQKNHQVDQSLMRNNKMLIAWSHKILIWSLYQYAKAYWHRDHIIMSFVLFPLYPLQKAWVTCLVYWSHSCHKHIFHFLLILKALILLHCYASFLSYDLYRRTGLRNKGKKNEPWC